MVADLGNGVFTFDHEPAEGKGALIATGRGAIFIDAGNEPGDGAQIVRFAAERGLSPAFLILTHGHGDHIFGWPAFDRIDVIASHHCGSVIEEQRETYARRFGRVPGAGDLPKPTIAIDGRLVIDCGDCTLEVFATPGHSPDSICVYIPERKTLVCGDTVVTSIPVAIGNGSGRELELSLARLAAYDAELLLAGHGVPLRGRAGIADWLEFQHSYLREIRRRVRDAGSQSGDCWSALEAAIGATPFEEFIGSRLSQTRYKMATRHENVVKKIFMEEFECEAP